MKSVSKLGATNIGNLKFSWGSRTLIMGIINMTPDSFSGDGIGYEIDQALVKALEFEKWGADIIDVGGESTRPKHSYGENAAKFVSEEESYQNSHFVVCAGPFALCSLLIQVDEIHPFFVWKYPTLTYRDSWTRKNPKS